MSVTFGGWAGRGECINLLFSELLAKSLRRSLLQRIICKDPPEKRASLMDWRNQGDKCFFFPHHTLTHLARVKLPPDGHASPTPASPAGTAALLRPAASSDLP